MNVMSKVASCVLASAIMLIIMACGNADNNEVELSAKKITSYVNANDYHSLKAISDTIIINEKLGQALVSHFQDSTLELSTAAMAVSVSPQKAALSIFEDVKSLNNDNIDKLKRRTRLLLSWYKKLNQSENNSIFTNTLDSLALQLDIDKQAKCYVMIASSPSFLASMVNKQSPGNNKDALINAIEKAYGENSNDLTQFRNALKK